MLRLLILLLLCSPALLLGQNNEYAKQIEAINSLIQAGKYSSAIQQSKGLVALAKDAQLTDVEAQATRLLARSILDDPENGARQQVEGIKALRYSASLYSRIKDREAVDDILAELGTIMGEDVTLEDIRSGQSSKKRRRPVLRRNDSLLIDKEILSALVATQDEAISKLSEEQMAQMMKLQRQNSLLDSFEIHALEDSLLVVQQQMRIDAQNATLTQNEQRRKFLYLLGAAVLVILGILYWRYLASRRYQRILKEKNGNIQRAKERSDELLRNILPAKIAAELKRNGKAKAQRHENTTVLFADFQGFSALAKDMEADAIVGLLDEAFQSFDLILRKHQLEKIKTIGDAYMCAGGVPIEQKDHALRSVLAAFEMQAYLENHTHFKARIGIHSGPVIAGVVGLDKFAYDIWGDTVNRAARLESAGEIGKVNISETTKGLLPKEKFSFTSRGSVPVKHLGEIKMYFVNET
jgi:class 3 adenylate cyclase